MAPGVAYRARVEMGRWGSINLGAPTLLGPGTALISGIGFSYFWDDKETKDEVEDLP